jgi:hypothetical protein
MGTARLKNLARIGALLAAVAVLTPVTASAGGDGYAGWNAGPSTAYSAPITGRMYPLSGDYGYQLPTLWDYTVPIVAVYQFPAVIANQLGSEVGYLRTSPSFGRLGGQPYLYHQ